MIVALYDPVSSVVAVALVFQPSPFFFFWILTGTAATQSVKAGSSVELTTPLALPLFFSLNVMALVCSLPVTGTQSGGGTRKEVVLNTAEPTSVMTWIGPSRGTRRARPH